MAHHRRLLVTILTVTALLAVIVLAAGLSSLQVAPLRSPLVPRQTPVGSTPESTVQPAGEVHPETLPERGLVPFIVIALVLLVVVVFMIVTAEGRKMLVYAALMLLFVAVIVLLRESPFSAGRPRMTPAAVAEETPAASPAEVLFEPPPWLVLSASLAGALLVVGAGALAGSRLWRRRKSGRASPLPALAEEARQALFDIQAGQDLRGTVIRCYREMVCILQERSDIRRGPAMTPQEFAHGLAATSLPQADIWRITRLFERVRYSEHLAEEADEAEAVACLQTIVQFVEGSR